MDWFLLAVPIALLPIVWLIRLVGCIFPGDFDLERDLDPVLIGHKQKDLRLPEGGENPYYALKCWVRLRDVAPAGTAYDLGLTYRTSAGDVPLPRLEGLEHIESQSPGTALLCFVGLEANVEYESIECDLFEAGEHTPVYHGECSPNGPLQDPAVIIKFVRFPETEDGLLETLNCLTPV